ncbi:MAG: acyltransferase [Aquaticitalea sp.]
MIRGIVSDFITTFRKFLYFFHSNNGHINGSYKCYQPVVLRGQGQIHFGKKVCFGILNSPFRHTSYAYIEARQKNSSIVFGDNINVNNGFTAISEFCILIKDNVLIGFNCTITDSNFHDLRIGNRHLTDPNPKKVIIEKNVFIGNNVTILKGVTIGENSVVAAGSVVTKSCPENVIIGGCPAKIINNLV